MTMRKRLSPYGALLAALAIGLAPAAARAQLGFTEFTLTDSTLNSSPVTDFWIASAAPADADADGDLDLLVAGYYVEYATENGDGFVEDRLVLYRNDGPSGGAWTLSPIAVDAGDLHFTNADLAWGDYDNDGDPDVAVAAWGAAVLYRNDGGTLVPTPTVLPSYVEDSDFTGFDQRSLTWVDYDNDGDLDLMMPSVIQDWSYAPTVLLRNDGAGAGGAWRFTDIAASLPVTSNGVTSWADLDADGNLDLLLGNVCPWEENFLNTYRNDGGTFVPVDAGLAHIRYGTADWGDADNDGDLDIVYGGNMDLPDETGETVVRILFGDGQGGYTPFVVTQGAFANPNEPWLDFKAVTWADYDSDGDVDLLISGEWLGPDDIEGRSIVYVNNGGGFTPASEALPAPIAGNAGGAFTWFDVDGDGDLDYFVAGGYYVPNGNGLIEARTQLFRNDAVTVNDPPLAPLGLQATPASGGVVLTWSPTTDDATPADALTYDVEVKRAGSAFSTMTGGGERALPQPGNVSTNTQWRLRNLAPGTYVWTVRALDNAFNGSAAAQGQFTLGQVGAPVPVLGGALWLSSARPNPARDVTQLQLGMDVPSDVSVAAFDARGRQVRTLHEGPLPAGAHAIAFPTAGLPSGVYCVRATSASGSVSRSVTVLR